MPHVAFAPMTGLRIRNAEMRELGMSMPSLQPRAKAVAALPSLALLTLAGMTPGHWSCSYHEADVMPQDDDSIERLADQIAATCPSLVAISAVTASIEAAYALSRALRIRRHAVVLGGLHCTAMPDEAMLNATSIVIGDGESVWNDVLVDAERGTLQPCYRGAAGFDLARSPLPRFDLLGKAARQRYTLQTQRGCPLACEFCAASRLLGSFREKPIKQIDAELRAIKAVEHHPRIELADDNTFVVRRDAEELLAVFEQHDIRYFTETDWRIGTKPWILKNLAKSGCVQALIGIESMVFRHPGMGAKDAPFARMIEAIDAIQDAGVSVIGCFIVGADGETERSIDRMVQFILESRFADIQLTLQTPFPGTALHRRLYAAGRLRNDCSWSDYTLFDVTYQPDSMTIGQLEQCFRSSVLHVFEGSAAQRRQASRRDIHHRTTRRSSCESETSSSSSS